MRRQTANQTFTRLAKRFSKSSLPSFSSLSRNYCPGWFINLPTNIDWAGHRPSPSGWFFTSFLADLYSMILVVIGNTLVQWANPLLYNRLIFSYTRDLRERIIHKLHRLPIAFVDRQGSGEMVSRVTTDIEQLAAGLTMILTNSSLAS